MSENCEAHFIPAARREWDKVAAADPARFAILDNLVEQVEENGWKLSTNAQVIKVLRNDKKIGEIRDVGSGGYRMFFFWHDTTTARELWVCRVVPKRDVEGRRRVNEVCDAVEKLRKRFLKENT